MFDETGTTMALPEPPSTSMSQTTSERPPRISSIVVPATGEPSPQRCRIAGDLGEIGPGKNSAVMPVGEANMDAVITDQLHRNDGEIESGWPHCTLYGAALRSGITRAFAQQRCRKITGRAAIPRHGEA